MTQNVSKPQPKTWVHLKKDYDQNVETAKAFCTFIDRFYWRPRENEQNEMHIVFDSGKQYKYYGVPREVFERAWEVAHNPSNNPNFGSFFKDNIKNQGYNYDKITVN